MYFRKYQLKWHAALSEKKKIILHFRREKKLEKKIKSEILLTLEKKVISGAKGN